jgi:hypothetical protein
LSGGQKTSSTCWLEAQRADYAMAAPGFLLGQARNARRLAAVAAAAMALSGASLAAPPAEEDESRTAESEDDVFARLRALSLVKDPQAADLSDQPTENGTSDSEPSRAQDQPEPKPGPAAPAAAAHEHEESIEDYMARLLQRVRGISAELAEPAEAAPERAYQRPRQELAPGKIEPRSSAPENTADLAAMRAIANLSTRAAIATHSFRRRAFRAWRMLAIAVSIAVAGALLFFLAGDVHSPLIYVGAVAVLAALSALGRAAYLARKARRLKKAHGDELATTPPEPVAKPASADIQEPAQTDET